MRPSARMWPLRANISLIGTDLSCFITAPASSLFAACEPQPPAAEPVARAYAAAWVKSDYQAMWDLLTDESKARVGEDGFLKRLPRIADEMSLKALEATTVNPAWLAGDERRHEERAPQDRHRHDEQGGSDRDQQRVVEA